MSEKSYCIRFSTQAGKAGASAGKNVGDGDKWYNSRAVVSMCYISIRRLSQRGGERRTTRGSCWRLLLVSQ